ncbi:membrane-spanning 4-domains subfamily A member 4A-like [Mugil cephalus]|uniref:membrane-spanning 4-domains subfamily A member 4A-like n=1 Tax=Mugil cephalus TaxID=48193 RepID=UPI001FB77733|nr:membrane-spanning 4-domains subfamily A member 4A-like [Mugil cephalus]XP_047455503.1 membrane-spanning 4-domains subfamily A member 4A-like [Mugil cephalus]
MASTSVTTLGGVVVVTQVIPKNENSIPLQSPDDVPLQVPPPVTDAPPSPPKVDDMTAAFLRGQPHGLGAVQIMIGLLGALFSLTAVYSWFLMMYAPFGLAVAFVVSGSLTLAAGRRTSLRLVWASLASNVLSVLLGLACVSYMCWLFVVVHPSDLLCDVPVNISVETSRRRNNCYEHTWVMDRILYGLQGLLLVLLVLQVCVSVTVSVFSVKAVRRQRSHVSMVEDDDCSSLLPEEE